MKKMMGWTRTVRNFDLFAGDICQSSGAGSGTGESLAVTTRRNNGARGIGRGGQSSSSRGHFGDFLGEGSGHSRGLPGNRGGRGGVLIDDDGVDENSKTFLSLRRKYMPILRCRKWGRREIGCDYWEE